MQKKVSRSPSVRVPTMIIPIIPWSRSCEREGLRWWEAVGVGRWEEGHNEQSSWWTLPATSSPWSRPVLSPLTTGLHYRIMVGLLLAASNISVAKQYFGDLINFQMSSGIESKVLDNYCWIHSTFHIRTEFQGYVGCLVDMELMEDKKSLCWSEYQHFSTFHPFLSVLAALRPQNWNTICAVILTLYWSEYHYFCTFSSLPILQS